MKTSIHTYKTRNIRTLEFDWTGGRKNFNSRFPSKGNTDQVMHIFHHHSHMHVKMKIKLGKYKDRLNYGNW